MNDSQIKWRVMTQHPGGNWQKRGLFETQANAKARAAKYRLEEGCKTKVVRYVKKAATGKPAVITGGV